MRNRGNPKTHRKARLKVEEPGQPGDSIAGSAEGCGIRGNSMNHRRKSRKMQNSGRPEDCIERRCRTVEDAGKPGDLQPAAPKDADSRRLEEPIAGTAWRHWRRGNPRPGQTRLNGTMHGPMPCEYTLLRRQRLRSLASSFVAGLKATEKNGVFGKDGENVPPGLKPTLFCQLNAGVETPASLRIGFFATRCTRQHIYKDELALPVPCSR